MSKAIFPEIINHLTFTKALKYVHSIRKFVLNDLLPFG